tara:strand:+ start:85 stop:252 length:168 start_codon:yes stop_codon:yes gene_type:complete
MHYLNEFDSIPNSTDIAQDRVHRMALLAKCRDTAFDDMEADGWYVNREEAIASSF